MWGLRRFLCAMLGATVAAAMLGKPLNISAGDFHTCAVMDDGDAVCFGDGFAGKLGTLATTNVGDTTTNDLTKGIVQLPSARTAVSISAGNGHTCAVMDTGNAVCFGDGSFGRLGTLAATAVGFSPAADLTKGIVQLPPGRTAVSISAGAEHTCALMDNGDAVCFGSGFAGRLGTLATDNVGDSPANNLTKGIVQLPSGRKAVSISTGSVHTCAVVDDGDAVCFGLGSVGQLGTLATDNVGDSPTNDLSKGIVQLPSGRKAVSISAGDTHTCAVMDNGDAVCFGDGSRGRLGTLAIDNVGDSPANDLTKGIVQLPSGRKAVSISAGWSHTCAVMDNGDAVCFGWGSFGRLGTESTTNVGDRPTNDLTKGIVQLPSGRKAVSISAGDAHTCAVMDDGNAVCFGLGSAGQLGTLADDNVGNSPTNDLSKGIVQLPSGRKAVSISAGAIHTCAVMDDGDAVCFGDGSDGRLGTLATTEVGDSPTNDLTKGIVQLPPGRKAVSISAGREHTCAVMDDGDAVCFGRGSNGRLGTLATDRVGDRPANDLTKGIVQLPAPPSPSTTSSPSPSVSPTTTATPSPSSSVSPTTTATPTPSSSVSPTTTATPSPSSSVSPTTTGTPSSSVSPTTTATPSPSSSVSPTTTATPSPSSSVSPSTTATPSSSVSPTTTATPSKSSSVSSTTTSTPSPSSPALDGLGSAAQGADTDDSGIGAGPIAAVALLAAAVVIAAAVAVHNHRSRTAWRTARSVPTSAAHASV